MGLVPICEAHGMRYLSTVEQGPFLAVVHSSEDDDSWINALNRCMINAQKIGERGELTEILSTTEATSSATVNFDVPMVA